MNSFKMVKPKLVLILLLITILSIGTIFVACKPKEEDIPPARETTIDVDYKLTSVVSMKAFTLPGATAYDSVEGDISGRARVNIFFETDEVYVYPSSAPSLGAVANNSAELTIIKIGEYKVTYFVTNSAGKRVEKVFNLTITANDEARPQNLTASPEDWVMGSNSFVNPEGYLQVGVPKPNEDVSGYPSMSYAGEKIKSNDIVTFIFNSNSAAHAETGIYFWNLTFIMTESYDKDAPAKNEGSWPKYLTIRITRNRIEMFFAHIGSKDIRGFAPQVSLLDGNDHTISAQVIATETELEYNLWVDANPDSVPTYYSSIGRDDFDAAFGASGYKSDLFSEDATGWFTISGYRDKPNYTNDYFVIKSMTINNAAMLETPQITVEPPKSVYILNEEIAFGAASAKDRNDYRDISNDIKLTVINPKGITELIAGKYIPTETGIYKLIYSVIDASGNRAVKTFDFNVSKGDSSKSPEIVFADGDIEENYNINLGDAFIIPAVSSVIDSFGDDIISRLKISINGAEKFDVTNIEKHIFNTPGSFVLIYEVADFNGVVTIKVANINVTHADPQRVQGNLVLNQQDWYTSRVTYKDEAMSFSEGFITYTGQKIYDEKVSMVMNLSFTQDGSSKNGSQLFMINVRGGSHLNTKPSGSDDMGWPTGLIIEFDWNEGIRILGGQHGVSPFATYKFPQGMRGRLHNQDVVFEFKATDIIENGKTIGLLLEIWFDGVPVNFTGNSNMIDKSGNFYINERMLIALNNANFFKSGWFTISSVDKDRVDNTVSYIKSFFIDGTTASFNRYEIDNPATSADLGATYTLAKLNVTNNGMDLSDKVKVFIQKAGDNAPDITGAGVSFTSFDITSEYIAGFNVLYVFEGRIVKTLTVTINATIDDIQWTKDTQDVVSVVGNTLDFPKITSITIGENSILSGFTYFAVYENGFVYEITLDNYVPIFSDDYYIIAKLGTMELGRYSVANTGVKGNIVTDATNSKDNSGASDDGVWSGTTHSVYKKQMIYNNTMSYKVQFTSNWGREYGLQMSLRGITKGNEHHLYEWPTNLRLFIQNDIRIATGPNSDSLASTHGSDLSTYFTKGFNAGAEYVITIDIHDVYEGGEFVGIFISLHIDGVQVVFKNDHIDSNGNCFIPKSNVEPHMVKPTYFGMFRTVSNDGIDILEMYLDGTQPAIFTLDVTSTIVDLGGVYNIPVMTVVDGGQDTSADVKVFMCKKGDVMPDIAGDGISELEISITEEHLLGFDIIYVYKNKVVKTISISVNAQIESYSWDSETSGLTSVAGEGFSFAKITEILIGENKITSGFSYYVQYESGYTHQITSDKYTPILGENFIIVAKLNSLEIGHYSVTNTGVKGNIVTDATNSKDNSGASDDGVWSGTTHSVYKKQMIYNNTMSYKVQFTSNWGREYGLQMSLRGITKGNEHHLYEWPTNLRLFIQNDIRIATGPNSDSLASTHGSDLSTYFTKGFNAGAEYVITIDIHDVYEGGELVGIFISLHIDGVQVVFKNDHIDSNGNCFIPKSNVEPHMVKPTYFGMFRTVSNDGIDILEMYLDGTIVSEEN